MQNIEQKSQSIGPVRVVLVDDSAMVGERLAEILSAIENVQVLGWGESVAVDARQARYRASHE